MKNSRLAIAAVVLATVATLAIPGVASASSGPDGTDPLVYDSPTSRSTVTLPNATIVNSDLAPDQYGPVVITVDPANGTIVDISEQPAATALSDIGTTPNNCTNNRPCWIANPPAATLELGFVGTGTISGSWPLRSRWESRNRESTICWQGTFQNFCSSRLANYAIYQFTTPATGLRVTLY